MKKLILLILCVILGAGLVYLIGFGSFGHEIYSDPADYGKIFDLTEIRFTEGFELFPEDITDLDVQDFYCEWELGIVGSATAEIHLAVSYGEEDFAEEILRLESVGGGDIRMDTENFYCPAYVAVMGYYGTSWYALADEDSMTVHYVLLQIIDKMRIDIDKSLIPHGYYGAGDVMGASYCIYE